MKVLRPHSRILPFTSGIPMVAPTLGTRSWLLIRETPESPRMFESDLVDLFSRTHPVIVPLLYVPGSALLCYMSVARGGQTIWATALLYLCGFVTWTLAEY